MFIKFLRYEVNIIRNLDKDVGVWTVRFYRDPNGVDTFAEILGGYVIVSRTNKNTEGNSGIKDNSK